VQVLGFGVQLLTTAVIKAAGGTGLKVSTAIYIISYLILSYLILSFILSFYIITYMYVLYALLLTVGLASRSGLRAWWIACDLTGRC
jgi:hypothetical protein